MDPKASAPPAYSESAAGYQHPQPTYAGPPPNYAGPPTVAAYPASSAYPVSTGYGQQAYYTAPQAPMAYPQGVAQTTYVQQQPLPIGQPLVTNVAPPPNHAVMAWLSCLLCFWPTGIVAVIHAHQVHEKMQIGDIHGANDASRKARQFSLLSFGIGIAAWIIATILIVIYIVIFASALSSSNY